MGEKLIGCPSYASQPGTKPATQACVPIGNRTGDLFALWGTPVRVSLDFIKPGLVVVKTN